MAFSHALGAVLTLVLVSAPAWGQLTENEQVCQQAVAKQAASFADKKIKCLIMCDKRALKGKAPNAECTPPYSGKTLDCVTKAESKAQEAVVKPCAPDCPECYADGDCTAFMSSVVSSIEAAVDGVVPLVRCDDSTSPDGLTKGEATVRQKVALTIGKFVSGSEKCLAKCRKGEAGGKIPAGSCEYVNVTDSKTIDCLIKTGAKALDYVEDPDLDAPECLEPELTFALPSASGLIEQSDPLIFCGSPSGAFVD